MTPKISLTDFEALVRRTGIALSAAEISELHKGWAFVEPMLDRIRINGRGREAEPALTFDPTAFGTGAP
jgi:hypothetical protein